jgi:hypothetical protein
MPIVLAAELGDEFLCLESNVRTRMDVLPVQPLQIIPVSTTETEESLWHSLLFHLTRPIFLPKYGVIRHPRLHGLPKYLFGEVRG